MAVRVISEEEFRSMLRNELDNDSCWEIVSNANGYDGSFEGYDFFDATEFYDIFCSEGKKVAEVIQAMRDGVDLDEGTSPADPFADYLCWDTDGTIDSANDPGQVIYDDLLDDIIDYIVDNLEEPDIKYPESIQSVIDEYNSYREGEEE